MRLFPIALLAVSLAAQAADPLAAPGTPAAGRSPEQLAGDWWKWAVAAPEETSPVRDRSGAHCAVGQRGEVWFLAGGYGSSKIRRTCNVPAGKSLYFPVINMVYWPREEGSSTCERVKRSATLHNDAAIELFGELDGRPFPDLRRYRVATSECFDLFERARKSGGAQPPVPAATDGYWLLLNPLPPGKHVLKFGGRYNRESGAYGKMVQDIEYELVVK